MPSLFKKLANSYKNSVGRGFSNREHLSPLIKRLEKRILDLEKVLTIKDDDSSENKENLTVVSLLRHLQKLLQPYF
jgi:hypothetical protein